MRSDQMNRPAKTVPPLSLQDAKAHFSEVVEAAMQGRVQHVTRRGKPAVVIVAADEYERMASAEGGSAPTFIEHLLAMPKTPKGEKPLDWPRARLVPRDVDFSG